MANRVFKWVQNDWYDKETGVGLVGLEIPDKVKNMVNYPIGSPIDKKEIELNIRLDEVVNKLVKHKDLVDKAFGVLEIKVEKFNDKQLELFKT
ncbi:hypothetical protein [Tenacibaculum finnmarkense]|nr:hypothetical protein [Tenacibaculum finnmarkense]MBE7649323.1 hypothetical protein [Tenacibaculum finnmarkense genomovar ulcerans]